MKKTTSNKTRKRIVIGAALLLILLLLRPGRSPRPEVEVQSVTRCDLTE